MGAHLRNSIRLGQANEQGFVLLAALWLLVLVGSIGAFLSLRTINQSIKVKERATEIQDRYTLTAALDQIVFNIVAKINQNDWARTPSSGNLYVNGQIIKFEYVGEFGFIDINASPIDTVIDRLKSSDFPVDGVDYIQNTISRRRELGGRFDSIASIEGVPLQSRQDPYEPCLSDHFTVYSGLVVPLSDREASQGSNAELLGEDRSRDGESRRRTIYVGEPIRLKVSLASGKSLRAVIVPGSERGYDILEWAWSPRC